MRKKRSRTSAGTAAKVLLLSCCFLPLFSASAATPAQVAEPKPISASELPEPGDLLRKLKEKWADVVGVQARFRQINRWVLFWEEKEEARGRLYLRRPNLFRIAYEEPAGHLMVCDGVYIWTYVPENQQVLKAPAASASPVGDFLLGVGRWGVPDSVWLVPPDSSEFDTPTWALRFQPEVEWGLEYFDLFVIPASLGAAGYAYEDLQGNATLFILEEADLGAVPVTSLFRYEPPEGIDVFETGPPGIGR